MEKYYKFHLKDINSFELINIKDFNDILLFKTNQIQFEKINDLYLFENINNFIIFEMNSYTTSFIVIEINFLTGNINKIATI